MMSKVVTGPTVHVTGTTCHWYGKTLRVNFPAIIKTMPKIDDILPNEQVVFVLFSLFLSSSLSNAAPSQRCACRGNFIDR